jgi:hypothetical protein
MDAALANEFQLGMRVIEHEGALLGASEFLRMKGHTANGETHVKRDEEGRDRP